MACLRVPRRVVCDSLFAQGLHVDLNAGSESATGKRARLLRDVNKLVLVALAQRLERRDLAFARDERAAWCLVRVRSVDVMIGVATTSWMFSG